MITTSCIYLDSFFLEYFVLEYFLENILPKFDHKLPKGSEG